MRPPIPVDELLAQGGGVIEVRQHPTRRRSLYRLVESKVLTPILPGVLVPTGSATDPSTAIQALARWDPDAVLTRWAAARLTFWPDLALTRVTAAVPRRRFVPAGFEVVEERIPPQLIRSVDGIRVTSPALTALDLAETDDGAALHRVLRQQLVTVDLLDQALAATCRRRGNRARRRILNQSRRRPWSVAERHLHHLLRAARIDGWIGNGLVMAWGIRYIVDIVFYAERVIIELDGYEFHRAELRDQFHRDRRKWTDLTTAGWTVVHVTWAQLTDDPEWVLARVRRALSGQSTRFRSAS